MEAGKDTPGGDVDIFRDTPVRYLGYANEVGEAFRAQVPVNVVRLSYAVATSYVCADAYSKGVDASKIEYPSGVDKNMKIAHAVGDTLIWQMLASVAIPGFTINRICALSNWALRRSTKLPDPIRKWTVTGIGLASIPFIIKPIDESVHYMMDKSIRPLYEHKKESEK